MSRASHGITPVYIEIENAVTGEILGFTCPPNSAKSKNSEKTWAESSENISPIFQKVKKSSESYKKKFKSISKISENSDMRANIWARLPELIKAMNGKYL